MDAADVFRRGVSVRKETAVSEFMAAIDEMPPDAFMAATMLLTLLVNTVCGER